jgi:hypothetical protein
MAQLDRMNSGSELGWFLDHQRHDVDSLYYQTSCHGTVVVSQTALAEIPNFERSFFREQFGIVDEYDLFDVTGVFMDQEDGDFYVHAIFLKIENNVKQNVGIHMCKHKTLEDWKSKFQDFCYHNIHMTGSYETMYTRRSRVVTRWFVPNNVYVNKLKTLQSSLGSLDSTISTSLENNHSQHSKLVDSHAAAKKEIHQLQDKVNTLELEKKNQDSMYQAVLNELSQDVTINITSVEDLKLHLVKKNQVRLNEMSVLKRENDNLHQIQKKLRARLNTRDMEIIDMEASTSVLRQKLEICAEGIVLANIHSTEDEQFASLFEIKNNQTTVKTNLMFVNQIFEIKNERHQMQRALEKLQAHSPQNTHDINKIQRNLDLSKTICIQLIKKIALHTDTLGTRVRAAEKHHDTFPTDIIEERQNPDTKGRKISLLPIPVEKPMPPPPEPRGEAPLPPLPPPLPPLTPPPLPPGGKGGSVPVVQTPGAGRVKPFNHTYTKLSNAPIQIPTFVLNETVFFALSKKELKRVSTKLRVGMIDEFRTKQKTNVPEKKVQTNHIVSWLDASDFSVYSTKHTDVAISVVTFLKKNPADLIVDVIGGFYEKRDDFFEIGLGQDELSSIIKMFPNPEKDIGYMKSMESRIRVYTLISDKMRENKQKQPEEMVFLNRLYKIPMAFTRLSFIYNIKQSNEVAVDLLIHINNIQECVKNITENMPIIISIFESVLLCINVLGGIDGGLLGFQIHYLLEICEKKSKKSKIKYMHYIVAMYMDHNPTDGVLGSTSQIQCMISSMKHVLYGDFLAMHAEVNKILGFHTATKKIVRDMEKDVDENLLLTSSILKESTSTLYAQVPNLQEKLKNTQEDFEKVREDCCVCRCITKCKRFLCVARAFFSTCVLL